MLIRLNGNLIMLFLENILQIKLSRFSSSTDVVEKPMKAYINSAGYDLFADESIEVSSNSRALISTGLRMETPKGYYGHISPRYGLALKNGVAAFSGTVDSGYLGVVYVLLFNFSSKKFLVEKGNRIKKNVRMFLFHLKISTLTQKEVLVLLDHLVYNFNFRLENV